MSETSPVPARQTEPPTIEQHVMEGFTEAVGHLAVSVTGFAEKFEERQQAMEESRRRDRRTWIVGIVVIILLVLSAALGVGRLNSIATSNRENNKTVKDCVTPTGDCYQRNQKAQQDAIRSIIDSNHNGQIDTQEILNAIQSVEARRR